MHDAHVNFYELLSKNSKYVCSPFDISKLTEHMVNSITKQTVISTIYEIISHILTHILFTYSLWTNKYNFFTIIDRVLCNASEQCTINLYGYINQSYSNWSQVT